MTKEDAMSAEETAIERIETALYGTGNPHGGLFQQFAALEGKVTALDAKIDGVEKKFDKMFSFAKWMIVVVAVPIRTEESAIKSLR